MITNPERGLRRRRRGAGGPHGRSSTKFDLILDVVPDGAPPFRTETRESFSESRFPSPGDSLRVRCNPEKHAVEIDLSEDMRFNTKLFRGANEANRNEEHDRILNAPPGTPVSAGAIDDYDPELAELARLDADEQARES